MSGQSAAKGHKTAHLEKQHHDVAATSLSAASTMFTLHLFSLQVHLIRWILKPLLRRITGVTKTLIYIQLFWQKQFVLNFFDWSLTLERTEPSQCISWGWGGDTSPKTPPPKNLHLLNLSTCTSELTVSQLCGTFKQIMLVTLHKLL